ncbi:MAG: bacillithiol biosynthesis cysteine-adding enzyme BshC [Flavobacteriales bacterium]|nr:bacillithiol biosynthesis cysteine-adding enzyme BshC [Flavobacteriales bacterium]MDW8432898.1 bacillithiol biosynthesis cysteine-adding enzyme BshC [Flavobacteriales bacterium]
MPVLLMSLPARVKPCSFSPARELSFLPAPVRSYLQGEDVWRPYLPPRKSLREDIADALAKKTFPNSTREHLVAVLLRQKAACPSAHPLLERLSRPNCYVVTTGHQPVLMGGPLFFWFKIAGALLLARQCRLWFPDKDFVPVFWLAGEDHDLAEVFSFHGPDGRQHAWLPPDGYQGAAGRYPAHPLWGWLKDEIQTMPGILSHPWYPALERAFRGAQNLNAATLAWLDDIWAPQGLLTINPDDPELKGLFKPWFRQELEEPFVAQGLAESRLFFDQHGFKTQLQGRPLSIFYLHPQARMALEPIAPGQFAAGTARFSIEELMADVGQLSPNAALRPLYQEAVLPNVAYVGGPAEMHYWLQLSPVFNKAGLPMPALVLRPMGAGIPQSLCHLMHTTGLKAADLSSSADSWIQKLALREDTLSKSLETEHRHIQEALDRIRKLLSQVEPPLERSGLAALKRWENAWHKLRALPTRTWKRRHAEQILDLKALEYWIYPDGIFQERRLSIWDMAFLQDAQKLLNLFDPFTEEGFWIFTFS